MVFDLPRVETNSDIETLFRTVGFVVVQCGFAEQALNLVVANIFHSFKGHPLLKRRPQNLAPKNRIHSTLLFCNSTTEIVFQ